MKWNQINENCIVAFFPEYEAMFAAQSLILGGKAEECPNYLGAAAFFRQTKRYIADYFSLAEEMNNEAFQQELAAHASIIEEVEGGVAKCIKESDALEFSQNTMGKTFSNKGPYEKFVFLPSVFLPCRYMRFFIPDADFAKSKQKQQLLFMNVRPVENSQDKTIAALKAISDKTRYQILALLSERGPIHGREIVKALSLAPSTVSHHMDQLKECGLVTEEQVRTSKYFGINKKRVAELFKEMKQDIKIK